jgi:hypothetical protein
MNAKLISLPTPQELAEARYQGATVGSLLLGAGLNPYILGTHLSRIWDSARLKATGRRIYSGVVGRTG